MSFDICGLVFHNVIFWGFVSACVLLVSFMFVSPVTWLHALSVLDTVHTRFITSYILSAFFCFVISFSGFFSCAKGFKCLPTAHFHSVLSLLFLCRWRDREQRVCVYLHVGVSRESLHFTSLFDRLLIFFFCQTCATQIS